jgi:preprotein translocase subunit SecG
MQILITIIHVLVCLFLIGVVLLQSGKAADLAGAFGGASQTVFGPRGAATALSKWTTIAAAIFMVSSMVLSILANRAGAGAAPSILDKVTAPAATAPATPGNTAPAAAPAATPAPPATAPVPAPPAEKEKGK